MDTVDKLKATVYKKKCSICENILSIPPVMVISEDGSKLMCGRCKDIKCKMISRCTFYEEILELLTFPCIYKKCDMILAWGQVEQHEKSCPFRTIHCPVYYQRCNRLIELTELEHHFTEKHPKSIHYHCASFNMMRHSHIAQILFLDNEIFYIYAFNYLSFHTLVLSLGPYGRFTKFNIKLNSKTGENRLALYPNQQIVEYDDRKHCFKCLIRNCNSEEHPNSQKNCSADELKLIRNSMCKEVPKGNLEKFESINVTISLLSYKNDPQENLQNIQEINLKESKADSSDSNYDLLRQTLECPICNQLMLAPIYLCSVGHAICKKCRSGVQICPYCSKEMYNTRCFALEQIAENAKLSCVYKDQGCQFIGKIGKVCEHEVICPLKP